MLPPPRPRPLRLPARRVHPPALGDQLAGQRPHARSLGEGATADRTARHSIDVRAHSALTSTLPDQNLRISASRGAWSVTYENCFKVTMHAPRTFAQMSPRERINACYQHAVIRHLSSGAMTNHIPSRTTQDAGESNARWCLHLIKETLEEKLIKPSDPENTSLKFSEYVPYWA